MGTLLFSVPSLPKLFEPEPFFNFFIPHKQKNLTELIMEIGSVNVWIPNHNSKLIPMGE